jgi:hypothetical protein
MALRLAYSSAEPIVPEPISSLLEETQSETFRALPPAVLDESHAPDFAVLTRFTGPRMLRGKIVRATEGWRWHFVLDTVVRHEGTAGVAESYERAKSDLTQALAGFQVRLQLRTDDVSLHEPLRAVLHEVVNAGPPTGDQGDDEG